MAKRRRLRKERLPAAPLTYKTVTIKKSKPYELSLSYPAFEGTPAEAADFLNAFVKGQLADCDGPVEGGKADSSYIDSTFEVLKLNDGVAVIREAGESYCAGNAHPSNGSFDHFIALKHKARVSLFEALSEAGKEDLIARIAGAGAGIAEGDECKALYALENLKDGFVAFEYRDGQTFTVRPSFSHAEQACEGSAEATVPIC